MEVAYASRSITVWPASQLAGLLGWSAALILLPAPLAARVFLAAPLVIVPVLLGRVSQRAIAGPLTTGRLAPVPALLAGALLAAALALPPGPAAAALALPWVGLTALAGLAALRHGLPRLRSLFKRPAAADLATDAALGLLAIGGQFLLVDRLGVAILGYGAPYTLLGAIHYHFLGFGLLALIAVLAGRTPGARHWLAALAMVAGVTLTALGLIGGSPLANWLGVLLIGAGGGATIAALLGAASASGGWRRIGLAAAALCLAVGLSMGVLWASATLFGFGFIGLELMVRTHGALNAAAVVLASLALAAAGEVGR